MKKRTAWGALGAIGVVALVAACAGETEDDEVSGDDEALKAAALQCTGTGGATFDVAPGKGSASTATMKSGATQLAFACKPPTKAAAKAAGAGVTLVATCASSGKQFAGEYTATVTKQGGKYEANVQTAANAQVPANMQFDLDFSCSAGAADAGPAAKDAGPAAKDAAKPAPAVASYAEVAPLIESTCSPCHNDAFGSVDQLKKRRNQMIDALSSQRMPRNNPGWVKTADGQKVFDYLQNSPDLK
jgi:hypothetical protein